MFKIQRHEQVESKRVGKKGHGIIGTSTNTRADFKEKVQIAGKDNGITVKEDKMTKEYHLHLCQHASF